MNSSSYNIRSWWAMPIIVSSHHMLGWDSKVFTSQELSVWFGCCINMLIHYISHTVNSFESKHISASVSTSTDGAHDDEFIDSIVVLGRSLHHLPLRSSSFRLKCVTVAILPSLFFSVGYHWKISVFAFFFSPLHSLSHVSILIHLILSPSLILSTSPPLITHTPSISIFVEMNINLAFFDTTQHTLTSMGHQVSSSPVFHSFTKDFNTVAQSWLVLNELKNTSLLPHHSAELQAGTREQLMRAAPDGTLTHGSVFPLFTDFTPSIRTILHRARTLPTLHSPLQNISSR